MLVNVEKYRKLCLDHPRLSTTIVGIVIAAAIVWVDFATTNFAPVATAPAIATQPIATSTTGTASSAFLLSAEANCLLEFETERRFQDLAFGVSHSKSSYDSTRISNDGTFKLREQHTNDGVVTTSYLYCRATDKKVLLTGWNETWPVPPLMIREPSTDTPEQRVWTMAAFYASNALIGIIHASSEIEKQYGNDDVYCSVANPDDQVWSDPQQLQSLSEQAHLCVQREKRSHATQSVLDGNADLVNNVSQWRKVIDTNIGLLEKHSIWNVWQNDVASIYKKLFPD